MKENLSKCVEIMSSCETSYTLETNIMWNYPKKNNRGAGRFEPSHRLPRIHSLVRTYHS